MSRHRNTLLPDGMAYANGRRGQSPQIDLSLSGQHGYQHDVTTIPANTGYTPNNLIALLVQPPRGFRYMNDPQKMTATLKSLIETQSKTITGIRRGYNVSTSERAVQGAGLMHRDLTDVTEEISSPTHTYDERYGAAISNYWMYYIRMLMGDPNNKHPGIMNLSNTPPEDHLVDMYTFTTLYIEPDNLRRKVVDAVMVTNMMPNTSGVIETQYDPTSPREVPELSIEFNGLPVRTMGVLDYAQQKLNEIQYVNAGPFQRPSFIDDIDATIKAHDSGAMEDIDKAARSGMSG